MWLPATSVRRVLCALASALLFSLPTYGQTDDKTEATAPCVPSALQTAEDAKRLASGDILIDSEESGGIRYVVARAWVDETPENTWRTMVNPYEFERKIMHRMKSVAVLTDEPGLSVMTCTIGVIWPIPDFKYTVESRYTRFSRVDFHRISGSFKDFRGYWGLAPVEGGTKTEITYSMYIDPGFPAPDWLIREAVKCELPTVVGGLRDRVEFLKNNAADACKRNVLAAGPGAGAGDRTITAYVKGSGGSGHADSETVLFRGPAGVAVHRP